MKGLFGMDQLFQSLSVIALILSVGSTIYAWLTAQGSRAVRMARQNEEEVQVLKDEITREHARIERRIDRVEAAVEALPDKDEFHALDNKVTAIGGKIDQLAERIQPVAETTRRLQEYLVLQSSKEVK